MFVASKKYILVTIISDKIKHLNSYKNILQVIEYFIEHKLLK